MSDPKANPAGGTFSRTQHLLGVWGVNSQYKYFERLESLTPRGPVWLDIGCGRTAMPAWLRWPEDRRKRLLDRYPVKLGLDMDLPSLVDNRDIPHRLMGSVDALPFPAESIDLVTANMVVEHLPRPLAALRQVARVLRPGRPLVFHTPNFFYPMILMGHLARCVPSALRNRMIARIEGRAEQDVFPTLYQLNTPRRIRRLAAQADLNVETLDLVESIPSSKYGVPGLGAAELLFMAAARKLRLARLRSNLIVVLRKPE